MFLCFLYSNKSISSKKCLKFCSLSTWIKLFYQNLSILTAVGIQIERIPIRTLSCNFWVQSSNHLVFVTVLKPLSFKSSIHCHHQLGLGLQTLLTKRTFHPDICPLSLLPRPVSFRTMLTKRRSVTTSDYMKRNDCFETTFLLLSMFI